MLKRILTITLSMISCLSLASCQAGLPTATPGLTPLSTHTPEAAPARTDIAQSPTDVPLCFTPIDLNPITFMPDSARILIRGSSGVQIFNLETMQEEDFIQAPRDILTATLSPDGERLVWSFEDHTIQLVQVSDGKILNTLKGHTNMVSKLRFSPSGDKLLSASYDGYVRIWGHDGELLDVLEIGPEIEGIGISSDGTKLATVPFDGPVELWDLSENKKITMLGGTGGFVTSDAHFSPDGQYLAADLATGLFLWRISDGKSLWDDLKNSMAVTFSPDGRFLAYSNIDDDNKVVLSSPDGTRIIQTIEGMQGPVWELFFSPDSSMLAAAGGPEIRIWQVDDGKLLYVGKASCP